MKNSYQNDIQTVQLGNIISSVGSLLDRSESMQETLSMFHLEQSAEILLQLLEAGDEPVKTEILTASFLGDVAEGTNGLPAWTSRRIPRRMCWPLSRTD